MAQEGWEHSGEGAACSFPPSKAGCSKRNGNKPDVSKKHYWCSKVEQSAPAQTQLALRSTKENKERNFKEKLLNPPSQGRVFPSQKQSRKAMSKNTVDLHHGNLNKQPAWRPFVSSCRALRLTEHRPAWGEVNCGHTPPPGRGGPGCRITVCQCSYCPGCELTENQPTVRILWVNSVVCELCLRETYLKGFFKNFTTNQTTAEDSKNTRSAVVSHIYRTSVEIVCMLRHNKNLDGYREIKIYTFSKSSETRQKSRIIRLKKTPHCESKRYVLNILCMKEKNQNEQYEISENK